MTYQSKNGDVNDRPTHFNGIKKRSHNILTG